LREQAATFTPFGRLAAVRGILTAASAAALVAPVPTRRRRTDAKIEDETHESWTLLYDGALPAVCDAMEKPRDSHYKFHASAALKASLQRASAIATAEVADATATASVVMSDKLSDRVLGILWANWEDPLSQTVKEVQAAFEHLLDVKSIFDRRRANANANANTKTPHDDAFLIAATRQLLNKGAHCKGRYVPLSVATRRLGARRLLAVAPELLAETLDAMRDDSVSCAAGTLVAALSAKLLEEMEEEEERAANGGGGDDDDASASAAAIDLARRCGLEVSEDGVVRLKPDASGGALAAGEEKRAFAFRAPTTTDDGGRVRRVPSHTGPHTTASAW
jgi:hypothetical protein